jgi:hypothetical protein
LKFKRTARPDEALSPGGVRRDRRCSNASAGTINNDPATGSGTAVTPLTPLPPPAATPPEVKNTPFWLPMLASITVMVVDADLAIVVVAIAHPV